jgi:hypothetical protein
VIQIALNLAMSLFFATRVDQSGPFLWVFRNLLSPGIAAYISLSFVQKHLPIVNISVQLYGFIGFVFAATIAGVAYNAEHIMLNGSADFWRHVVLESILNAIAAISAAIKYARQRTYHEA